MRVRIYEVGAAGSSVVLIDELPTCLALTDDGHLRPKPDLSDEFCRLEDLGGQLFLKAGAATAELEVNNAPLEEGPLMPGDRLRFRGHDFLVSYEQTSQKAIRPPKYRIQR
jgi:hypothetical protein